MSNDNDARAKALKIFEESELDREQEPLLFELSIDDANVIRAALAPRPEIKGLDEAIKAYDTYGAIPGPDGFKHIGVLAEAARAYAAMPQDPQPVPMCGIHNLPNATRKMDYGANRCWCPECEAMAQPVFDVAKVHSLLAQIANYSCAPEVSRDLADQALALLDAQPAKCLATCDDTLDCAAPDCPCEQPAAKPLSDAEVLQLAAACGALISSPGRLDQNTLHTMHEISAVSLRLIIKALDAQPAAKLSDVEDACKELWLRTKPSVEAQRIRASIRVDDNELLPECVWDIADIAAQMGMNEARCTVSDMRLPDLPEGYWYTSISLSNRESAECVAFAHTGSCADTFTADTPRAAAEAAIKKITETTGSQ